MNDTLHNIAFSRVKGMNRRMATEFIAALGSEKEFFTASQAKLKSLLGFDSPITAPEHRHALLEEARAELQYIEQHGIAPLHFTHPDYPQRLHECDDAPTMLFTLGRANLNPPQSIAVVGTRHATLYGIQFVKDFLEVIARRLPDTLIVSGLAYGIDIAAHKQALDLGLPTVAVVAHGLSTIYPSAHRRYAAAIVRANGALVTEYTHATKPFQPNFLARNRIIAALADCVVVVESAKKGGAMVTAEIAGAYNRDVFALPGRITDTYSQGCNNLVYHNKAAVIQSADDLIAAMGWADRAGKETQKKLFYTPTPHEQAVIDYLTANQQGFINNIAVATAMPIHRLMSLLVDMEFKGLVTALPGGQYRAVAQP